ncbi:hypothetical protein XT99_002883 [Salmonella enterica subsp. enterica]|nr:hypothetical protein [Salmonella enterica subsp. enterica serovar Sandiego]
MPVRRIQRRSRGDLAAFSPGCLPAPVSWAVPPSPARGKRFNFCARTDPASDRASTGRKGQKIGQKNCAKLCKIVRVKK